MTLLHTLHTKTPFTEQSGEKNCTNDPVHEDLFSKLKGTTARPVQRWLEAIVPFTGGRAAANLPFAGSHLAVCHPASYMEFAAPFGTAKKGKAAQVEEVQPMAADPSSCSL